MALVTHKFKLDLTPGAARQVLYTSQGDIGRPFEADLYWNGSPWTATGTTANIRGKKPDDTVFDYTATVSGTAVTFETTEQMTIISGPVECELVFSNDGDIIASANFVLMVEDSPYNPDAPSESVVPGIEDLIEQTIGGDVSDEVDAWLDAHPEATTTVQDGAVTTPKLANGAVTYAKIDNSLKAYVTPEMFGAVGDGTTDDTAAWQAAVNSGYNVRAIAGKTYKIGQVTITNNIDIDCGMSSFIQTGNNLFLATGTAEATTGTSANYSHYQSNYALTDTNKPNYTGYAFLKGTNSLDLSRDYYKCGFPASFKNGYMTETYPVDVENPTVTYYTPITVHIRNILDITAASGVSDVSYLNGVHIKYGVNCSVENVNASDVHVYMLINIDTCLNTLVNQIFTHSNAQNASGNSYMIGVMDSCFTNIENCELNNDNWHCITNGGTTLVYKTTVRDCALYTKNQFPYCDHANAIDTVLDNITCTYGLLIAQNGEIRNSKIYAYDKSANSISEIQLTPTNFDYLGNFKIENVEMYGNNTSTSDTTGVQVVCSLGTGGVDSARYLNKLYINNVYVHERSNTRPFPAYVIIKSLTLDNPVHVKRLELYNTNLSYTGCDDTMYNVDLSDCVYIAENVSVRTIGPKALASFGTAGYTMPANVYVNNSEFSYPRGNYKNFRFGFINILGFDATKATFTGEFVGDIINNENSMIIFTALKDTTKCCINRFKESSNDEGMNLRKQNDTILFNIQSTRSIVYYYADASTNWASTAV